MSAKKRQHPAKRTEGAAEKPASQQFKQHDDDKQQPFKGQILKKHQHHHLPANEARRGKKDKERCTQYHAEAYLTDEDKPQNSLGKEQSISKMTLPGKMPAKAIDQFEEKGHRADPGAEHPTENQGDADRNDHADQRGRIQSFTDEEALKPFKRRDKPQVTDTERLIPTLKKTAVQIIVQQRVKNDEKKRCRKYPPPPAEETRKSGCFPTGCRQRARFLLPRHPTAFSTACNGRILMALLPSAPVTGQVWVQIPQPVHRASLTIGRN